MSGDLQEGALFRELEGIEAELVRACPSGRLAFRAVLFTVLTLSLALVTPGWFWRATVVLSAVLLFAGYARHFAKVRSLELERERLVGRGTCHTVTCASGAASAIFGLRS